MPKAGPAKSSNPSQKRPSRDVRSSPVVALSGQTARKAIDEQCTATTAQLSAAGEKSRLEFQRTFGVNFKAARLKSSLKQSEVAIITGLTQQYLSLIEAGQQNVTIRTMTLLAKVVDRDLLDLLNSRQRASLPTL